MALTGSDSLEGGGERSRVRGLACPGGVELVGAGGIDEALETVGTAPEVAGKTELLASVGGVGLGPVM